MLGLLALTLSAAPVAAAFGFSNADGTRLLALGSLSNPQSVTRALCEGKVFEVKFVRLQPRGAMDTGRRTARNFSQTEGPLFAVQKGRLPADTSCLLGNAAALAPARVVAISPDDGECDAETQQVAQTLGQRGITRCVRVARVGEQRLAFVSYSPKGEQLLAGVVLTGARGLGAARLFPAVKDADAPSCWRADDGCEFLPTTYRLVGALRGPEGFDLFALWDGAEGQNLELLRVKGSRLDVVASEHRYWAPE
jgi:hypothetical protein